MGVSRALQGLQGTIGQPTAQVVGGSLPIGNLSDVTIVGLANGEILQYNSSTGKWENQNVTITEVDGGTY